MSLLPPLLVGLATCFMGAGCVDFLCVLLVLSVVLGPLWPTGSDAWVSSAWPLRLGSPACFSFQALLAAFLGPSWKGLWARFPANGGGLLSRSWVLKSLAA